MTVSPPECPPEVFPLAAFLDGLRVELAGRGLACCTLADARDRLPESAPLLVRLDMGSCSADTDRVQVSVREAPSGRLVEHVVSLTDVAEAARPRALALAVAELIRSLTQAPPEEPPATVVSPAPPPPPPPAPPVSALPGRSSLQLEAEWRTSPTRDTTTWGGRLRWSGHRRWLHADVDVGGGYGQTAANLGQVDVRSASLGVGLGPRLAARRVALDLGLRAELGWAWLRGHPAYPYVQADSGSSMISSVGLRATLEFPAHVKVHPCLGLEGGLAVHGVRGEANRQVVAGMTGFYLLAALGLAVSP